MRQLAYYSARNTAQSGHANMVNTPYKVCPNCGQRLVPDMPACGRCGYSFAARPRSFSGLPRRNFTTAWLITGVLVALCAVVYLFGYVGRASNPFLGKWRHTDTNGVEIFQVNPDGTVATNFQPFLRELRPNQDRFTWRIAQGRLLLIRPLETPTEYTHRYAEVSDDHHIITVYHDGSAENTYFNVGDGSADRMDR